ncbi:MAG: KpsF/GutQ family sugar-phosphate isomerase [Ignavibacteria bacterium]|nr:KpsF/GutQ family sugar-phosphate isomerase [Ignavibacteria bacterium]
MNKKEIITNGKHVIKIESDAIHNLLNKIDDSFSKAVELILNSNGRVIISGVGKSGIIARKIVATFNSTGTSALFMHPSDAIHGDLGMVRKEDVVILISKSGSTQEIVRILPILKRIGTKIIAMVGDTKALLAKESDVVLDVSVKEEACPFDLAPTSSSTATLVMGDALAISLLKANNFSAEEFAFYHPGGNLGKRLTLKVDEIMTKGNDVPIVSENTPLHAAILEMTTKRLGATCVVNANGVLIGIITDGDLRRAIEKRENLLNLKAIDLMGDSPKIIDKDALASVAIQMMETYKITQLVIVDDVKKPVGMVHLHDLVNLGFIPR